MRAETRIEKTKTKKIVSVRDLEVYQLAFDTGAGSRRDTNMG